MTRTPVNAQRRRLVIGSAATATAAALPATLIARSSFAQQAPAVIASESSRPSLVYGLQFGDPRLNKPGAYALADSANVIAWTRADRDSRLQVEWSLDENFASVHRLPPLYLTGSSDYTGRIDLGGLPGGQRVFVRMSASNLDSARAGSEVITGSVITPSHLPRNIRFVWGGDTAGQGWGISPNQGGMLTYQTMLAQQPQFFIHSGDTVYADGPIAPEKAMPDGQIWQNIVTEQTMKVAESLEEFRARYRYNLMDEHVRRFNHEVPQIWQWDDHEITNNWSDSKDLSGNTNYTEKRVALLTARGAQAFREYAPMRSYGDAEPARVYRHIPQGPLLDVFMIDMRSYRGPNSDNLQSTYDEASFILGPTQIDWIKRSLKRSSATWKVIGSDMPIGLQIGDGQGANGVARWEAVANGDPGRPLGREAEIADLLAYIRREGIRNVVWLTADVHYCAAHHYSPARASFKDFDPFWEFVAGPLHAGGFGPNKIDDTFGPDVVFVKGPAVQNEPPSDTNQFFGQVDIDAQSGMMLVSLIDRGGSAVFTKQLTPA